MADENKLAPAGGAAAPKPLLTVHDSFEDYVRGDQITEPDEAKRVLATYPYFVTKLA